MSTRLEQIRQCRLIVRKYEYELASAKDRVKDWKADLRAVQARLNSLLDDEADGLQELPFGKPDEPPVTAEAATDVDADHEEDEPDWHGEPLNEDAGRAQGLPELYQEPVESWEDAKDAKDEADAVVMIEAGAKRAKGRNRKGGG